MFEPARFTRLIAWLAVAVAFFSASQDVVLDAYRREILADEELGMGNAIHVQACSTGRRLPVYSVRASCRTWKIQDQCLRMEFQKLVF